MKTSFKGAIYLAALALLAIVCYAAIGSDANDGDVSALAISVKANGEDTASIPDFDGDGTIGFGDFVIFAGVFGARQGDEKYDATYDLNDDGEIGFSDFVIFAENFGKDVPSPAVAIPDANLSAAIETALGKASDAPITRAEMATLDSLAASDADITDLTGLEYAVNLTWLDLASNDITNISVLADLTNLTHLILSSNNITDLAGLAANTSLGAGGTVDVTDNPLNAESLSTHVPTLQARGVSVSYVPSPVVAITDTNLRAAIEAALDKATGAPITQAEMATLTHLEASFAGIRDLTGLEFATNLTRLGFWDNEITDVSPLAGLTNLTYLELGFNNITDVSPLAGLTNLRSLGLFYNYVTDISVLSGMPNLARLTLGSDYVRLTDISPLAGLTKLNYLFLAGNAITDISPLAGLDNLKYLNLWGNKIKDISPLASLASLTELHLGNNPILDISLLSGMSNLAKLFLDDLNITDITLLGGLTNLTELGLSNNAITDISALAGLTDLTVLRLANNAITDISVLSGLTNLTELRLDNNNITDISVLSGLTNLTELRLDNNNITDISVLSGLTSLKLLIFGYNSITDVSALEGLTSLIELSLRFNVISDISALSGLTNLKWLWLEGNPLNDSSINDHISVLQNSGTKVKFDPPRPIGDFDIELVFLDSFTEKQKNVLRYVARRWMAVISEDLPDFEFTQGWSGRCGDQLFEIPAGERIDDLRIYMTTFDDNPDAVGWGGPSLLREESHLPVLGCMGFDLERANLLITGLHEVGHVLGFGPVWNDLGFLQDLDGDTHFNGPLAIAAFDDAGGRDYTGAKVPVSRGGAHWRVPLLSGELMGPSGGGALSAITVQSLADLGYGVDVSQADAYTLPGATAGTTAAKITSYEPSARGPVFDLTRAIISPSRDADLYGQGRIADEHSSILADGRWTGRLEGAERFWGHGINVNLWKNRQMRRGAPSMNAEPELTCGAGLMNEPIYVVDPQGRVVRTIDR